jgi:2-polyprenyl-6-methoxyphenol hydroxylase-like FAD-dependent oxidoreductase
VATRRHAEIAGGGIAGLVAAAALAQRGWSVRVHERADHMRAYGAAIFTWYNLMRVLKAVGAWDEAILGAAQFRVRESRDAHNRVINTIVASDRPDERIFCISRRQLVQALASAATRSGADIELGAVAVGAEAGGALLLEDGRRLLADLVVGADGVYSKVRDSLGLARRRHPLGDGAIRLLIPRTQADHASDFGEKAVEFWSGRRRLFYSACSDDEVYLAFMLPADDAEGAAVPVRHATWIRSFPFLERLEDPENPHAVAVVAQRIVPVVGVAAPHSARRGERPARHVEREEFQRGHDPERHPCPARPLDRLALEDVRVGIAIVVHAGPAVWIDEVVCRQGHRPPRRRAAMAAATAS